MPCLKQCLNEDVMVGGYNKFIKREERSTEDVPVHARKRTSKNVVGIVEIRKCYSMSYKILFCHERKLCLRNGYYILYNLSRWLVVVFKASGRGCAVTVLAISSSTLFYVASLRRC